mgnify:CR=1 FL=1
MKNEGNFFLDISSKISKPMPDGSPGVIRIFGIFFIQKKDPIVFVF